MYEKHREAKIHLHSISRKIHSKEIEQGNFSVFVRTHSMKNDQERCPIPHAHTHQKRKTQGFQMTATKQVIYIYCFVLKNWLCVTDFAMFMLFGCGTHTHTHCLQSWVCITRSHARLRFTQSIVSIVTHFDVDGPCCLHGYFQDDFCWFLSRLCSKPSECLLLSLLLLYLRYIHIDIWSVGN